MIRPGIRRILRLPLRSREHAEREMDEEIRLHLELRTEQLRRQGRTAAEARAEALRRFGPPEEARGLLQRAAGRRERSLRVREWLAIARQDGRYAARSFGRAPGLMAVIVLTLALGIGLCTSIYSVVRGVILDPAPFPEAHQLLAVQIETRGNSEMPLFRDLPVWASEVRGVASLAAYTLGERRVGYAHGTVEAFSVRVTDQFFGVLRAEPHLGRMLTAGDASATSEPAAVISHRLWRDLFGADPAAIGSPMQVGGRSYSLVGILQPGHEFPAPVDVWTPLVPGAEEDGALRVTVIGRLQPGATREQARVAMQTVHRSLGADDEPEELSGRVDILPITGKQNEAAGLVALLLALSVGSILLIGVANAAGLILTRALTREKEIAIRTAMGASRLRISTLLLTEALILALAAAGLGLLLAHLALVGFQQVMPESLTRQMLGWEQIGLDGHMVMFAVLLALIAALGCTLVPVIGAARPNLTGLLQQSCSAATWAPRRRRVLRALVVGEVALSVVLLLCAALLSRSLLALVGDEPGFATDGVATLRWNVGDDPTAPPGSLLRLQAALLDRAVSVPGVASAALTSELPATREGFGATRAYEIEGSAPNPAQGRAQWRVVSPGYLETVRIPVLQGRTFTTADGPESQRVALVSESFARRVPSRASVLGSRVSAGGEQWTIVGVAGDVRGPGGSRAGEPTIYVPQPQSPTRSGHLVVQLAAPLGLVSQPLRQEVWSVDPAIALAEPRALREVVDDLVADQRIVAALVATYAATALVITLISLYAIVAHLVVRQRRELGIRAALGASPRQIVGGAMRRVLTAAVVGTLAGTLLAAGLARVIASLLYGVTPLEPSVFGVLPVLLAAIFALAVYLPARAAARMDPMTSLRS